MVLKFNKFLIELKKFEKNKFIYLSEKDVEDYKDNLYDLISKSYAYMKGYPNMNSPLEIVQYNKKRAKWILGIDLDDDPYLDAIIIGKYIPKGIKHLAIATDGEKNSKRTILNKEKELLNTKGYYIEASDRLAEILLDMNIPTINEPDKIKEIIDRDIIFDGTKYKDENSKGNGWYRRELFGEIKSKILFGIY